MLRRQKIKQGQTQMTDKKTTLWLLRSAGKYKIHIVCLLLLNTLVNGGAVCYALIMKCMVDNAVGQDRAGFFTGLITFGFLMLALMFIRVIMRQLEEAARSGMENNFKERLFEKLLRKDYGQVSAVHSEEWMSRMTSDTVVCANGMTEILPGFMGMLVRMIGALLMMFFLQPKLSYILIPGGAAFVVITLVLRKYVKAHHKRVQEMDGATRVFLQERISSMLVLRTFGVEEQALSGARGKLQEHKNVRMRRAWISNLCNAGFSFAINGMYLIGIGYCGYGILNGVVSYGTLTAIIQLIGQLQAPLSGLSGFVPRFYTMLASAERMIEIESYKESGTEEVKTTEEVRELYDREMEAVLFEEVSFAYKKEGENCPVLREVCLSVDKGDYVAITGTSGCGKSTLLKLLMGVYEPQGGRINVVRKDGSRQTVDKLRRLFSYVPQGNYLMGGTIREVITFGKAGESKKESIGKRMTVEMALELACGEFVFELSEGCDTLLGEKGAGLSEGQMQRIAIARALYADAPILILDEATSALDGETESRLLHNLKQLTDKTVFIVTHRPEALKICNKRIELGDKVVISAKETGDRES